MDSAAAVPLERKSSIEKEPRTLSIQQIQLAREAALYVVSTRSVEEALRIFTEGLEPVMSCGCAQDNRGTMIDYDDEFVSPSGRLRTAGPRDIASAPF